MIRDAKLDAARDDCDAARNRLQASIAAAKARLRPSQIASDAVDGLKAKGSELATESVDALKRRPTIVAGVVAVLGLVLTRRPIARVFRRWRGRDDETV